MDYLRYYLNCLLPLAAIAGFVLDGQWVWLGIGTLLPLLVIDALSPQDYAPRKISNGALADVVIYVQMLLVLATFGVFAWRAHVGFDPALGNVQPWVASALALVWIGLIANVGVAHELMHRHHPLAAFIGKLGFGIIGAPNRDISHTVTHHLYFDTARDFDTAQRGESVYRFVPRCIVGNTRDEWDYERRRLAAQGLGLWHWKSQIVWGVVLTAAVLVGMYWAGGVPALLVQVAAMIGGRILGEALNYLQHFGLLRVPGQPIEDRHTWNHLSAATRILGLEITNHVEHHQDPDRPYYALVPRRKGPQMRNILLWGIAAFFPPIWNRVIQPRLKDWDLNHANADERALAREANRRAGWPDWLGEAPQAAVAQTA
jgi:alkane 1-monooxygenase